MNKNLDNRIINLIIFNNIIWGVDEGIMHQHLCYSLCTKLELNSDRRERACSQNCSLLPTWSKWNKTKTSTQEEEKSVARWDCNWNCDWTEEIERKCREPRINRVKTVDFPPLSLRVLHKLKNNKRDMKKKEEQNLKTISHAIVAVSLCRRWVLANKSELQFNDKMLRSRGSHEEMETNAFWRVVFRIVHGYSERKRSELIQLERVKPSKKSKSVHGAA